MNNLEQLSFDNTAVAFASRSTKELKRMYWLFAAMNNRLLARAGTFSVRLALKAGLPIEGIIKRTIFKQFCGGENIEESEKTIQSLAKYNIGTILDYAVEGEKTEKGFEETTAEIIRTIDKAKHSPHIPFCVFKATGVASSDILERKQNGMLTEKDYPAYENILTRIESICKHAYESSVRLFIDGEESWIQDAIDEIVYEMMRKYNQEKPIVYNTYQMYRKDMLARLKIAFQHAATYQYYLGAKLVRGAYMEKERHQALVRGYEDPIHRNKTATDIDYNRALKFCLDNKQRIALCSGSHNEYSNYYLLLLMEKHGLKNDDDRVYFAQLYGMSDNISFSLAKAGFNVVKYVPYGSVRAVMPYLFRRAEENTSIAGQSSRELLLVKKELSRRRKIALGETSGW